jgi:hypothetical protein
MHGTGFLEVLVGCLGVKGQWLAGLHQLDVPKPHGQVILVKLDAWQAAWTNKATGSQHARHSATHC